MNRQDLISAYPTCVVRCVNQHLKLSDALDGEDLEKVARDHQRLQEILREWAGA